MNSIEEVCLKDVLETCGHWVSVVFGNVFRWIWTAPLWQTGLVLFGVWAIFFHDWSSARAAPTEKSPKNDDDWRYVPKEDIHDYSKPRKNSRPPLAGPPPGALP